MFTPEISTRKGDLLKMLHSNVITLLNAKGGCMEYDLKFAIVVTITVFTVLIGFALVAITH